MDEPLSPEQVATQLNIPERAVRDWLETGALAGVRIHGHWRVKKGDLAAFLGQPTENTDEDDAEDYGE